MRMLKRRNKLDHLLRKLESELTAMRSKLAELEKEAEEEVIRTVVKKVAKKKRFVLNFDSNS